MSWKGIGRSVLTFGLYTYMIARGWNFVMPDKGSVGWPLCPENTWASWRLSHYDASVPSPRLAQDNLLKQYASPVATGVEFVWDQATKTHWPDHAKAEKLEAIIEERESDPRRYLPTPTREMQQEAYDRIQNMPSFLRPGGGSWYNISGLKSAYATTWPTQWYIPLIKDPGPSWDAVRFMGDYLDYDQFKNSHTGLFRSNEERAALEYELDTGAGVNAPWGPLGSPMNLLYGAAAYRAARALKRRREGERITSYKKKKAA